MIIVDIFAEESPERLYSFQYEQEAENEFDRLMELWTDTEYLRKYAKENKVDNINKFVRSRLRDAENIQDFLDELIKSKNPLEHYFRPLNNQEIGIKELSLQKGKVSKRDGLRIYAIKIGEDCFVITGGAIKMSLLMKDHPDTEKELKKIEIAKAYLKKNGVFDSDSFYEFNLED